MASAMWWTVWALFWPQLPIGQPSMMLRICSRWMPPPSSGGIHLLQILNIMEGWPIGNWGQNSAQTVHHMAEAMKLAYADRAEYLGDPDYVKIPQTGLVSRNAAPLLRSRCALSGGGFLIGRCILSGRRFLPGRSALPGGCLLFGCNALLGRSLLTRSSFSLSGGLVGRSGSRLDLFGLVQGGLGRQRRSPHQHHGRSPRRASSAARWVVASVP